VLYVRWISMNVVNAVWGRCCNSYFTFHYIRTCKWYQPVLKMVILTCHFPNEVINLINVYLTVARDSSSRSTSILQRCLFAACWTVMQLMYVFLMHVWSLSCQIARAAKPLGGFALLRAKEEGRKLAMLKRMFRDSVVYVCLIVVLSVINYSLFTGLAGYQLTSDISERYVSTSFNSKSNFSTIKRLICHNMFSQFYVLAFPYASAVMPSYCTYACVCACVTLRARGAVAQASVAQLSFLHGLFESSILYFEEI